jgi:hypothetical protein
LPQHGLLSIGPVCRGRIPLILASTSRSWTISAHFGTQGPMRKFSSIALFTFMAACGDHSTQGLGDDAGSNGDSGSGEDGGTDTTACYGTGLVRVCLPSAPTQALTIDRDLNPGSAELDTTNSPRCALVSSGGEYCVLAATNIVVNSNFKVTGTRPLVLVASESIMLSARIDVGSHRTEPEQIGAGADPAICTAGSPPSGGGGGAGGGFVGTGGAGGTGGSSGVGGTPGAVNSDVKALRGGCPGQDGSGSAVAGGGHAGGAVFFIAGSSITVTSGGSVNAAGEGGGGGAQIAGEVSGGAGGGSGGMIGFDAPTITVEGLVFANGGGGGEGSAAASPIAGQDGADPIGISAALGGSGNTAFGGDGGDGSSGATNGLGGMGSNGTSTGGVVGGGGGGGGAGLILVRNGAILDLSKISPAPTFFTPT